MTITEIKKMSTIERLRAMEELWDALCREDKEIESPEWHGAILENRRKKIETGKAESLSIGDMKARRRK